MKEDGIITQSTEMCRWRKSVWKCDAGNQSKFSSEIVGEYFPVHLFFVVSLVVSGSVDHRRHDSSNQSLPYHKYDSLLN